MFDSWVLQNDNQEYQTYLTAIHIISIDQNVELYWYNLNIYILRDNCQRITFIFCLGLRLASFLAAASIDAAAPNNSFSAITVGSSGSTHSEPKIYFYIQKCIKR